MLELNDPLWMKLDDAYGHRDSHITLAELAVNWDEETTVELFWGNLCHQDTVYGATYAAIPHLLKIAEPDDAVSQRQEIAVFLGSVVLNAWQPGDKNGEILSNLPDTIEAWDRKLDCYRNLVAHEESAVSASDDERDQLLPKYKEILAQEPFNGHDLETVAVIRKDFFQCLPAIRRLCERALRENQDADTERYLLSGVAAADGLSDLARLLSYGPEGMFACGACGHGYEYILFGDQLAIYADALTGSAIVDRGVADYSEGAPSRADGFVVSIENIDPCEDDRVKALYALAEETTPEGVPLLRRLLGEFVCVKCGAKGPLRA
jgi:hypothetical protein